MAKEFRLKLVKSPIGGSKSQKDAVRCLGLRKMQQEVTVKDNPAMRGQIRKVQHLLRVTPIK